MNEGTKNTLGGGTSFYKAIVLDVITDAENSPGPHGTVWGVPATDRSENAPENSCVIALFGAGGQASGPMIAYPFFPPHLSVPITPGEAVWVVSPPLSKPDTEDCYWVCKISGTSKTEDVNLAHLFRKPATQGDSGTQKVRTSELAQQPPNSQNNSLPGFLNTEGGVNILKPMKTPLSGEDLSKGNPFNQIFSGSKAIKNCYFEPVPGFVKRPGDLVIQGSNNSVLWLGQDRGFTPEQMVLGPTGSSANIPPKKNSGTIDIVAGRSRYIIPEGTTKAVQSPLPIRTGVSTVLNTRGYFERDKNSKIGNNPLSGDLDFDVDASRIYVSMKTNGDKNFALTNEFDRLPAAIITGSIQPVSESAYIIAKSDEVRIIARKQLENQYYQGIGNPEINGSIRIIKEGTRDDDLASIMLLPDGTIQVSGSRIFLGRHPDDGGKDDGGAGPDDSLHVQPYVRYKQLEDLLNAILDNIDAFCNTLNTHVTPGYGSPSPQILEAAATLKSEVASRKGEIVTLKSERIFGE